MSLLRSSPVHDQLASLEPQWQERRGMRIAVRVGGDDAVKLNTVALADLSFLPRFGLKGPAAAQWLEARNIALPALANSWAFLPGAGLIARLGNSEFFLEDGADGETAGATRLALGNGAQGVYPVLRQDAGFALAGARVNDLLVQTCNVDFAEHRAQQSVVVMTQMIGVAVLVIRADRAHVPCYRLWCDPTLAPYLWETLAQIAAELGGGVISADGLPV